MSVYFKRHIPIKKPERSDENGGFLKRFQKWNLFKKHSFENAPFLVWIGENGGF